MGGPHQAEHNSGQIVLWPFAPPPGGSISALPAPTSACIRIATPSLLHEFHGFGIQRTVDPKAEELLKLSDSYWNIAATIMISPGCRQVTIVPQKLISKKKKKKDAKFDYF